MATADVQVPSYNRREPGSYGLDFAKFPTTESPAGANAHEIAHEWVSRFNRFLLEPSDVTVNQLFLTESYWRDQLALSWDFHTFQGPKKIISFLHSGPIRVKSISLDGSNALRQPNLSGFDAHGKVNGVVSFLTVETDVGRGRGLMRLVQDLEDGGIWKAFTLFTAMHELKGHEETVKRNRPNGVEHGVQQGRKNWQERRKALENFDDGLEPTVLIIGAGQGGLTVGARLQQLKLPTLIVDRCSRVGDNWRNRYDQLVLHDPVWYDHLPYLPFPPNWPVFTPKDKLADWFEYYANILELNIWTSTEITSSTWSNSSRQWTVTLSRKHLSGETEIRTLHPRHIIQATGHSGEGLIPDIKGMASFTGNLCHSSKFKGAQFPPKGFGKKRAVVVGSCNSGHDIAQDFHEHGYEVTMVQRSSTYVMSSEAGIGVLLAGLYEEGGPDTEDADLMFMSVPNAVVKRMHLDATKEISRRDEELRAGLEKAGFKLDNGPDDAGFFMKYFQRGGGYYIDVGCSALIASGAIRIQQGQEVAEVTPHSVRLADGTDLPADELVFATGYQNMRTSTRAIFGDGLADQVKDVWGFDEEGELRTIWRRTNHPGFWFFGGNLALCRYFSRMLALQIKALEVGLMAYGDR